MHKTTQTQSLATISPEKAVYRKTILDNGLRIVTETIPYVRSVSIGLWTNVGSRDEDVSTNGVSHFLEHMVFKGTRSRNVRDIAQSLESLGGYMNAFTTKEQTCYWARVLDEHVTEALDVLSDLIQHPLLRQEDIEKEKQVVIEEMRNSEDDPEDIIHEYFEKALFPEHPIGFPIIGTEANVRRFKRSTLRAHVASHYHPSRVVLAAAGNIQHDVLVGLARKYLGKLGAGARPLPRRPVPPKLEHSTYAEYIRPISQAHVCLGTVSYSIRHRDRYPLMVMNALLGEGMSSRLYQNIRERYGFAYSVYSYLNPMSDTGIFGAYIATDRKNIENSIELIHKELNRLKARPVPKSELERTKSQIKGTLMLSLENMSGRMMRLGSGELYFESFSTLDSILRKVDAVTQDSIVRVANDLFKEERFSTVVIRPAEA